MIKLPVDLFSSYPVLFILIVLPALIAFLFKALNARTDHTKVTLKYIEIASTILKPTVSTTNKKQIYLTEQLFQSHYKHSFTYTQISVLLNCDKPSQAISEFRKVNFFLKLSSNNDSFIERDGSDSFIYKPNPFWTGVALFILYLILAPSGLYLGIAGLGLYEYLLSDSGPSIITAYIVTGTIFLVSAALLFIAYKSLSSVFRKSEAKYFLKEYF
jgi:hypothetical protein